MGIDTLDPSQKGHRRFAYGSELVAVPTCCRVDVELVRTSILVNISSATMCQHQRQIDALWLLSDNVCGVDLAVQSRDAKIITSRLWTFLKHKR